MFISVLVANYNQSKYIEECLRSIFSQTLSKNLYEVILYDDKSTDNSLEIVRKMGKKPANFKLIQAKKNIGLSGARGTLIKKSSQKATHIFFVDSDDFIDKKCLSELVETLKEFPRFIPACATMRKGKIKSTSVGGGLSIINTTQHSKLWPKQNLVNISWPDRLKNEDDYVIPWALGEKEIKVNKKAIYYHRVVPGSLSSIKNKGNAKRMIDLCINNWDLTQRNLSLLHHSVTSEGASKYYKSKLKEKGIKRPTFLTKIKYIGFKRAFADFWTDIIFR